MRTALISERLAVGSLKGGVEVSIVKVQVDGKTVFSAPSIGICEQWLTVHGFFPRMNKAIWQK